VRVLVSGSGPDLTVGVENDPSVQERPGLSGTGRGLIGLRERVSGLVAAVSAVAAATTQSVHQRGRAGVLSTPTPWGLGQTAGDGASLGTCQGPAARRRRRPPIHRCEGYPNELTTTEVVSTAGSPDWSWGTATYTVPVQLSLPSETAKVIR
jgi:hypothetical protein